MSDDELTVEQKEEQRLMKALLGAGKNKPKVKLGAAASNDAPAPAVEEKAKSPRQAGEIPEWKKRQLENEEKIRQQMEKEQKEKEQRIANAHHNPDAADTPLSPRFSGPEGEIHKQHAKQLGQFLEGKTDMKTAKQLAEEEKERLSSIFKEQPKSKKNRFAAVSEQAKANIAAANERNAKEAAEAEAREKQEAEKQAKQAEELKKERIETAQKQLATAAAHYASDNAKELHTNDFEADIVKEIEALRNDPKSYAAKLRARRVQYEGKIVTLKDKKTGATVHIQTNEGVAAVDDALKALENASAAPLTLERALTRAMFAAVQQGGKVNAVADVASYGKVSGSARQIVYRGPVLDAEDVVVSLLIDDGEANRSRRDALLADKFKHFGIAAATNADGKFNYAYLLLLSNFEEKK